MSDDVETLISPRDALRAADGGRGQPGAGAKAIEFSQLYKDVRAHISKTLADLSDIKVASSKGSEHLTAVRGRLSELQERFSVEIEYLDSQAEWEIFTMAFFGETNAGKSTIIDSLRIIFQEQERQALIRQNAAKVDDLRSDFSTKSAALIEDLSRHYRDFAADLADLSRQASQVRSAVQEDNVVTRETVVRETKRMVDVLEARHDAFQNRMADLERDVTSLQALVKREHEATRTTFAEGSERVVAAIGDRARAYCRDMAALGDDINALAQVVRNEAEAAEALRKRRDRLWLVGGIATGVVLGVAGALAVTLWQG